MGFAECSECSRPTGGAAGECLTLHRCELKSRIAPLCCECTYTGLRNLKIKRAPDNWQWIRNGCRSCKVRRSAKCGGIFQKKTLSQLCVCGLMQADHDGLSPMFAMGYNAHHENSEMSGNDVNSESAEVIGQDARVSAAFVSPRRHREGPSEDGLAVRTGNAETELTAPFEQRAPPRLIEKRFAESSNYLYSHAGFGARDLPQTSSTPALLLSQALAQDTGGHPVPVYDYYSMQADAGQSNAIKGPQYRGGSSPPDVASYVIPAVDDDTEDAETITRKPDILPGNSLRPELPGGKISTMDGQLLPEEAELLRREVDTQRRMLQDHDNKLREQHGELVELAEQKRNLEVQMESTVQHVVKVMSEDKKRLKYRIDAMEQEQAQVINHNHQLQGLVQNMGNDLQGKMHELGNLHGRVHRDSELAKRAIKTFRQISEESGVETARSKSSLEISITHTARMEEKRASLLSKNKVERDELGERVMEVAGRFAQIDRANSRMLAQLSSSEGNLRELKELRSQYHELKGKEELQGTDATTLQTRVLDLEEQLADAL